MIAWYQVGLWLALVSVGLAENAKDQEFHGAKKSEDLQLKNRVVLVNGKQINTEKENQNADLYGHFALGYDGIDGFVAREEHGFIDPRFALRRRKKLSRRKAILRRKLLYLLAGARGRRNGTRYRPDEILALPTVPGEEGVVPLDADRFEGSYVAISGRPGERTLHVVNGRGGVNFAGTVQRGRGINVNGVRLRPVFEDFGYDYDLGPDGGGFGNTRLIPGINIDPKRGNVGAGAPGRGPNYLKTDFTDFAGYSPLPRCSYVNTDFLGDDVGDGKGISVGSAIGCKQACQSSSLCKFWTYRDGWARDCYLKRGKRGNPNPTGAIPKIGFISGTEGNDDCLCLPNGANSDEEICPVKSSRPIYPWKNVDGVGRAKENNDNDRPFRFDYDDYELGAAVQEDGIDPGFSPLREFNDFEDFEAERPSQRRRDQSPLMKSAEKKFRNTIKRLQSGSRFKTSFL